MSYREHVPHPALAPWVDRLWTSEADGPGTTPRVILPDGCIDVMVHVDATRGARAVAVGTMTHAIEVTPGSAARTVAVRFRPGAALAFVHEPAERLTDRSVAPFEATPHPAAAVQQLEDELLRRVGGLARPDARVAHAVARLFAAGAPSIEDLADELDVTRQYLGRVFRAQVGVGPKHLARVARLQRTVELLQRRPDAGLAESALLLGFSDQAHMTREVRALTGLTPQAIRSRAPGSIPAIRSLLAVP